MCVVSERVPYSLLHLCVKKLIIMNNAFICRGTDIADVEDIIHYTSTIFTVSYSKKRERQGG